MTPASTARFKSTSANPAPSLPMSRSVVNPWSSAMRSGPRGAERAVGQRLLEQLRVVVRRGGVALEQHVGVPVDEAGQHVVPAQVDHGRAGGDGGADLPDAAVLDHDHDVLEDLLVRDIEQPACLDGGHRRGAPGGGGKQGQSERQRTRHRHPPCGAGCCCVRQCSVPRPHTRSTAWMPTTGRSGKSSARTPSATAVGGIVEGRARGRPRCRRRSSRSSPGRRCRRRRAAPASAAARPRARAVLRAACACRRSRFSRERRVVRVRRVLLAGTSTTVRGSDEAARSSTWPCVSSPAMPWPSQSTLRAPSDVARARASSPARPRPGLRDLHDGVEQALLGREQRAAAVDVDGAALEHDARPSRTRPARAAAGSAAAARSRHAVVAASSPGTSPSR